MEEPINSEQPLSAPKRTPGKGSKRKAPGSAGTSSRPRGQKVTVACEECREKKRKCSGTRPQCDGCAKKGLECVYGQYDFKRGWPSNFVELMNGRIAELEKAKSLDMRLGRFPSTEWLGLSETVSQSKEGQASPPSLQPSNAGLNGNTSRTHSLTNIADPGGPNSRRSSNQLAAWQPSNSGPSTTQLTPISSSVRNFDIETSIPGQVTSLDEDKDESCVDAMGAMAGNETGIVDSGKPVISGFFGTSSAVSFMSKVQEAIRNFKGVPAINFNEGVSNIGPNLSANSSNRSAALLGLPWKTGALNQDYNTIEYLIPARREADALTESYFKHVFCLRPYLNRATFQKRYMKLWAPSEIGFDQEQAISVNQRSNSKTELEEVLFYITLNLVFALGCRTNPSLSPHERITRSESFFQRTQKSRILEMSNEGSLELVQSMLLMGQYLQSTERPAQCWNVVGFAIRVAQGIGLHLDLPATTKRSQLEIEMRRRVWWGCIVLDRELSMTYGRPCMVHPAMNCGIRLPSIIDDHLLSDRPPMEAISSENPGVSMAFFVYALKLSDILCEILITLHNQDCFQRRESSASDNEENSKEYLTGPNAQNLLLFDTPLNKWLESLPPYLRVSEHGDSSTECSPTSQKEFSSDDTGTKATLKQQANILYALYLHVRILLLRPLLSELFDKEHAPPGDSEESGLLNTILQQTMLTSISNICVSTAQKQIDHHYHNVTAEGSKVFAWWYGVYHIYTCATVILTGRLCSSINGLNGTEGLARSWDKALGCLDNYRVFSQPAQKGFKALSMIDQRLFKSRNAGSNGDPQNTGGPNMIPTPMEGQSARDYTSSNIMSVGGSGYPPAMSQTQVLGGPSEFQLSTAGDGRHGIDPNGNINFEGVGMDTSIDFGWNRDDLQLDWLNSMPFVNDFQDGTFAFEAGGGYM